MVQHLEDGVPVVEQLHRQGVGLGMIMVLRLLAGGTQLLQRVGVNRRKVNRRAFPRGIHRCHQGFQGIQHLVAEGPRFAVIALGQSPRLANQVRPTAQPPREAAVGDPAIGHQPALKPFEQVLQQFLAPPGDVVEGDGGGGEHPQPQPLTPLRPRRFVSVQQLAFEHCLNQLVFGRRHGSPRFMDRLVDRADAQLHP